MIEGAIKPTFPNYRVTRDIGYPYNINRGVSKRRILKGVWTPYQSVNSPESVDPYVPVVPVLLPQWPHIAVFNQEGSIDSDLYNYVVNVVIPYDENYMKTDFGDIRFATVDGQLIDYYILSKTNGVTATFQVKIPYLPISPGIVQIMIYAGNDSAGTTSNHTNLHMGESSTTHAPTAGSLGEWSSTRLVTSTLQLAVYGNVFGESPESSPIPARFGVSILLGDGEYTNITNFNIEKSKGESTFDIDLSSAEDEQFYGGQDILFNKYSGASTKKMYMGLVQEVAKKSKSADRSYTLKGRGMSLPLIQTGFTWVCAGAHPTVMTASAIVDYILTDTNIDRGPGVDLSRLISNNTKAANGWCGSFDTKKAAIDSLMSIVSEFSGRVVNWFVDKEGYFRTFYGDDRSSDLGIVITDTNPRVISLDVTENTENIINDITGYYGKKGQYSVHLTDTDSINGWTTDEDVERPGFGVCKGEDIKNTNIMNSSTITRKLQMILTRLSMPIYTVDLELARYPEVEVGQPLYLPDEPMVDGETFIASKVKIGKNSTKITATTDLNAVSPPSEYQSVNMVVQKSVRRSRPKTGQVVEVNDDSYVIQLDAGGVTLNVNELS